MLLVVILEILGFISISLAVDDCPLYEYIDDGVERTYAEAQEYCDANYNGLATMVTEEEFVCGQSLIENNRAWTGLQSLTNANSGDLTYLDGTQCPIPYNGVYGQCVPSSWWEYKGKNGNHAGRPRCPHTDETGAECVYIDKYYMDNDVDCEDALLAVLCNEETTCNFCDCLCDNWGDNDLVNSGGIGRRLLDDEKLPKPKYDDLKKKMDELKKLKNKCDCKYKHQCAITLSRALIELDPKWKEVFKKASKGTLPGVDPKINICEHGYVRGAQDLGRVLISQWGTQNSGWTDQGAKDKRPEGIEGKKGVILFMKIKNFEGQGHVDVFPDGDEYWNSETIWFWNLP